VLPSQRGSCRILSFDVSGKLGEAQFFAAQQQFGIAFARACTAGLAKV